MQQLTPYPPSDYIEPADLRESLEQAGILDHEVVTALGHLLDHWGLPAGSIPSMRLAHKALLQAQEHLIDAINMAESQ